MIRGKLRMKKWIFGIVIILLLLSFGAAQHETKVINEELLEKAYQVQEVIPQKNKITLKVTTDQIYTGNLLLVNKDHPVPQGAAESKAVNLFQHKELVQGFSLLDKTIQLSPSMVKKFSTMIEAAEKKGVSQFLISSGYRDNKRQNELYEEMGAEYAMPAGHSEHNLGLSIDIGSTQEKMNKAPEGKWLSKNAWKYGFILRYPKDKTDITGTIYEPWHFRYVGLPHSAIMKKKNFVLEEYLDFLKEQKTFMTTIENQTYKIFYYQVSSNTTIHVPENGRYEISGDNMEGVIITEYS